MKELKELVKNHEILRELNKEETELREKYFSREITQNELSEKIKVNDEKTKKEMIKKAILKNNIAIKIKELFINEIFEDLQKYNSKNIGEKTKEKIQKEIQEKIKEKYNINISCYYNYTNYISSYSIDFRFYLLNEENTYLYNDNKSITEIHLYFKNGEKVDFNKNKLENENNLQNIIRENEKTIDLKDIKKQVNKIYNNKMKINNKIEEYQKALDELNKEFKQDLYNNLYNIEFLNKYNKITIY